MCDTPKYELVVVDPGWDAVHAGPVETQAMVLVGDDEDHVTTHKSRVAAQLLVFVGNDGDHAAKDTSKTATAQDNCANLMDALAVRAWQYVSVVDGVDGDHGVHK